MISPLQSTGLLSLLAVLLSPCAQAEPIGFLAPHKSKEIVSSPWGIQSGDNERVTLFERAGELGVKWTRFLAVWPEIEKRKRNMISPPSMNRLMRLGRKASPLSSVYRTATNSTRPQFRTLILIGG